MQGTADTVPEREHQPHFVIYNLADIPTVVR
jgi:hypothetical protein